MAKSKKSTKKSASSPRGLGRIKRIHHLIEENFLESVAMVSILLNVFFITGIVLYHNSDSFETKVYRYTISHYCGGEKKDVSEATYNVLCRSGEFKSYYDRALTDYKAQLTRRGN